MMDTLGRFRILEPLGADFIGSRYLAFDPQINRQVVLRTLDPASEDREGLVREHFLQEARTAARLSHPNIIKVFGIHTDDPQPFVVLENLEGPTLELLLAGSGPLPVERTVRLLGPVADALGYAHSEGVIHRDVRPGAILVLPGDQPALTGFVMAKMADVVSAVTRQGLAVGTPGYASPELVTGGITDLRGDIFSLGAVIYETLTGCQAFVGGNLAETLYRIAHTDPKPPSSLVPELDQRHDRLLLRALAKSPERRQQTMGELRAELDAWLTSDPEASDLLADTDEIPAVLIPLSVDIGGQLVVPGPGKPVAAAPGPEPVPRVEPDPEPMVESGLPPAAQPEMEFQAEPVSVPEAMAKGPEPTARRRRVVPVITAAVVVVLVSLLAAWQFGRFGSGPVGEAGLGNAVPHSLSAEVADASPAETGDTSFDKAGELPGGEAEGGDRAAEGPDVNSEPPVDQRTGGSVEGGGQIADAGKAEKPPEEAPAARPTPTGALEVASQPWSRVTLDGKARGETPLRIDGLAEGEHRMDLIAAEGRQWSGVVTVRENRSTYFFHNFREDV
jgi:hypothetical protein